MDLQKSELTTSPGLIVLPAPKGDHPAHTVGVYDFLSKAFAYLSPATFYWFEYFQQTKTWDETLRDHNSLVDAEIQEEISDLVELGFIVISNSRAGKKCAQFRTDWKWDLSSAIFHFTVMDNEFSSAEESATAQQRKLTSVPSPDLALLNGPLSLKLPSPFASSARDLVSLFSKRRTNRTSSGHEISQAELSACLFSGLGITGFVKTPTGDLPLSMTPSGGARNPFEAYVFVRRGADIESGVYHYSALQHSLQKVAKLADRKFSEYLANQEWAENMSALVVLVADLERTMWKYSDPNAYRVVLIEAGHIAQNMMVAATNLGLTACPTAALCHSLVSEDLDLAKITKVPLYALTLDKPLAYADQFHLNDILIDWANESGKIHIGTD